MWRLAFRPLLPATFLLLLSLLPVEAAESMRLELLGRFRVSYYWVAEEDARYRGLARGEVLRDPDGRVLARVSRAYRRALELEGSGRLADGRVLNVAGRRDGEMRFREVSHPWGLGVDERPLEPFVSVATDPERIPTDSELFVSEFAGYLVPGGGIHRGRFRADDVGSAIQGNRIDIFIGSKDHLEAIESRVCPSGESLSVYRVEPQQTEPD